MTYAIYIFLGFALLSFLVYLHHSNIYRAVQIKSVLYETKDLKVNIQESYIVRLGQHILYFFYLVHSLVSFVKERVTYFFKKTSRDLSRHYYHYIDLWKSFDEWLETSFKLRTALGMSDVVSIPSPPENIFLTGSMKLPKSAYVDNSCIIELDLLPEFKDFGEILKSKLILNQGENGDVNISIHWENRNRMLNIALIGIGIEVKPILSETKELGHGVYRFSWGCHFTKSGFHSLALRVKLSASGTDTIWSQSETSYNHTVKVVHFFRLTFRQVKVITAISCLISTILALILSLKELGIF